MYHNSSRNRNFRRFPGRRRTGFQAKRIDVSLYVKKARSQPNGEPAEETIRFAELPLQPVIQEAVARRGYVNPTPIQAKTIPPIIEGKDVIGIANTGTGKTAAFALPLIQKILADRTQRVLILVPTRELGLQISEEIRLFAQGLGIYTALCIGGRSMRDQIYQLTRNPHIIIATPGRLKDLIRQNANVRLETIHTVVLDEADRMVDMGFIDDVTQLLSRLPKERQSLCFSATIPNEIAGIVQRFLTNPVTISVSVQNVSENIDQDIVRVGEGKTKIQVLEELLRRETFDKVLIFGRTKWGVDKLSRYLNQAGFKTAAIHGDKRQRQREQAIALFKREVCNILVATDVAARGIDIPDITHVINFDQPASYEDYIHRIGRTGRSNKKGQALTFV